MWRVALVWCLARPSFSAQQRNLFTVKPIEEVVRELGYPIERHEITTSDDYILTYHRIPHGKNATDTGKRKVVLFNGGILMSSASALATRDDFAYLLADVGFDVWLGNYRGNMYSRRHKTLNPDRDKQFWDFSLHELGALDLPASIDYILAHTGTQKLLYIGASMGTTMFWVLGAAKTEYMNKVEAMVAIAPVARPTHTYLINNWARFSLFHRGFRALQALNYHELFPYRETTGAVIYAACTTTLLRTLCTRILDIFGGLSGRRWDIDRLLEATKYGPAGISTKVVIHFMQIAKARRFQQYDYGPLGNQQLYQTDTPPEYNLKNVNVSSIYFVHSEADQVATKQDVKWLSEQLPSKPKRILSSVNNLGHVDLALDKDICQLLVQPLIDFLKQFSNKTL